MSDENQPERNEIFKEELQLLWAIICPDWLRQIQ